MGPSPHTDPDVLRELYVEKGLTQQEIADQLDVSDSTISNWIREHNIEREEPAWRDPDRLNDLYWGEEMSIRQVADRLDTDVTVIHRWMDRLDISRRTPPYEADYPWHDESLLRELYFEEELSQQEIADRLDTTQAVISDWFGRHGIDTPSYSEAGQMARRVNRSSFSTTESGYEIAMARCGDETHTTFIHRLVAVSEYGFDKVAGNVVHHKNNISWDNRPENLRPMGDSDHKSLHRSQKYDPHGVDSVR